MRHEIAQAAGQIEEYLKARGESAALRLRSDLRYSQTQLYLALGWLSRDGKVDLVFRDKTCWVVPKP